MESGSWGQRRGPDELTRAADGMADAIRRFLGWRSPRNEEAMREAVAAYDEIRPRGAQPR